MTFYEKKIPVFFFFTDDITRTTTGPATRRTKRSTCRGMRRVVDLTEELAAYLTTSDRPEYDKVSGPSISPGGGGPRLGIKPDYGDDKEGVLLSGVAEGEPASRAGLKAGDRIVEIAGQPVKEPGRLHDRDEGSIAPAARFEGPCAA